MDERVYLIGYLQAELDFFGGMDMETAQRFVDANPNPCWGDK